jgi:hypothetical protein
MRNLIFYHFVKLFYVYWCICVIQKLIPSILRIFFAFVMSIRQYFVITDVQSESRLDYFGMLISLASG